MVKAIELEAEVDEEEYRNFLDEIYPAVELGSLTFDASKIIEELDPIAFRVGMADYASEQPARFECGECGEEHANEDDAEECCQPEEERR